MCIVNTGLVLNQKFCVYLLSPSNHFDLTLEQKNKSKQNALPRAKLKVF